jgi:AraC family transcriptional regulator of adaptative response/methylated-DNA-[protein]-cysteine methyltransferase
MIDHKGAIETQDDQMPKMKCNHLTRTINFLCKDNGAKRLKKIFANWTDTDHKQFIQYVTLDNIKDHLLKSRYIIQKGAINELHNQIKQQNPLPTHITHIAANQITSLAADIVLRWTTVKTLFGQILIGILGQKLCAVYLLEQCGLVKALTYLRQQWPKIHIKYDQNAASPFVLDLENCFMCTNCKPIPMILQGTEFQIMIWKVLMQIPKGLVLSYGDIASLAGYPKAYRAVGTAIGRNPIAYLIPCHRVINASGTLGRYRWGPEQKRVMVAIERVQCSH